MYAVLATSCVSMFSQSAGDGEFFFNTLVLNTYVYLLSSSPSIFIQTCFTDVFELEYLMGNKFGGFC